MNGLVLLKLMENVVMDIGPSTTKHFHYAFDCQHLELRKINI
jgi:hypothetical protein